MPPSQAALLKELEGILARPGNKTCADCPARNPNWASIVLPPFKGGREMGVFICGKCYKNHNKIKECVVKSMSMATECKFRNFCPTSSVSE